VNSIKAGSFFGSIIDFLIIAMVIQWLTKMLVKPTPVAAAPEMKTCPECKETIVVGARKCKFCGSAV